jgi:type IV pilus assembly protein PilV
MMLSQRQRRQLGVGLIEVLVALFVISVGLLGVAKMQGAAIADTGISSRRAIAAIQAASLAATMHADKLYWATGGVAPSNVAIAGATVTNSALAGQTAVCTTTACSPIQMAAYDVQEWATQLNTLLPNVTATIKCSQVTNVPVTCTIQISWAEKTVALNNNASQAGTESAPTYTLFVEP